MRQKTKDFFTTIGMVVFIIGLLGTIRQLQKLQASRESCIKEQKVRERHILDSINYKLLKDSLRATQ